MARYRDDETIAAMVKTAVERIAQYDKPSVFVKLERARTKAGKLEPTDNQGRVLRYVQTHESVSFEESLGMDWRFLGGLFTRGLVEWQTKADGSVWLVPAAPWRK